MANQQPKTRATKQTHSDDEIDLFELLHFLVKSGSYWLSGALIFSLIGVIYALAFYPTTYKQQTINDIELTQESLTLLRQVMPALTVPLEDMMQAQGLEELFENITEEGADFLDETIFGISGVDMKDKTLDSLAKGKVDTVVVRIKGDSRDLAERELNFIRNNIRGVSQFLEFKKFFDFEIMDARIQLFNTEAKVNEQQLAYERASNQSAAYRALQKESNQVRELQIILNLSNEEVTEEEEEEETLRNFSEFSGAKYLPLDNRIVALESEMADLKEGLQVSEFQIEALKLSQKVLDDLVVIFKETPYQGDLIDITPMLKLVQDYRQQKTDYTREEIAALNKLERKLISFDLKVIQFTNSLPMVLEKKGRLFLILISGFIGAFFGLLLYSISSLFDAYRRRYKN